MGDPGAGRWPYGQSSINRLRTGAITEKGSGGPCGPGGLEQCLAMCGEVGGSPCM